MSDFTISLRDKLGEINTKMLQVAALFPQRLFKQCKENTPIISGFLRNSWYIDVNNYIRNLEKKPKNYSGGDSSDLNMSITNVKAGDIIYIGNGAEYAIFVEYGTSKMEGRFMANKALSNADSILKDCINSVNK